MAPAARFAAHWLGCFALFVVLQLVIAGEGPDAFGLAVLAVCALPVAALLTRPGATGRRSPLRTAGYAATPGPTCCGGPLGPASASPSVAPGAGPSVPR